jgi:hypothetical protein
MRPIAKFVLACLVAGVSTGCTTAEQIRRPNGDIEYVIGCGASAGWNVCYQRANEACPSGYNTISEDAGINRKELRISCPAAKGTPLSYQQKNAIVTEGVRSCIANERKRTDSLSQFVPDDEVREYCECTISRAVDHLTVEDARRLLQSNDVGSLRPVLDAAGQSCVAELTKKRGLTQ